MLFWYGKEEVSRAALQAKASLDDGKWKYSDCYCNGCRKESKLIRSRFACMECIEIDLCRKCMALYEDEPTEIDGCEGHIFLDATLRDRIHRGEME
jgi:hypothetical protein